MKFKTIFILFNIVLALFVAALCIVPFFVLGNDFLGPFWTSIWPILMFLLILIGAFDAYFISNRRLYSLLEQEDWPALARYLEGEVIGKAKYTDRRVKLLANSYLVLSDPASVLNLESKVGVAAPELLNDEALVFGTARILAKDYHGAASFLADREGSKSIKGLERDWLRWYRGFALLLARSYDDAAAIFAETALTCRNAVISALSAYFLDGTLSRVLPERKEEFKDQALAGKARALAVLKTQREWDRETAKLSTEIYAAALAGYMKKTAEFLYAEVK